MYSSFQVLFALLIVMVLAFGLLGLVLVLADCQENYAAPFSKCRVGCLVGTVG